MNFKSGLTLQASIIIASLIIGASLCYSAANNKYEITGVGAGAESAGALFRLDKGTGKVDFCIPNFEHHADGSLTVTVNCSGFKVATKTPPK